ncbi:hypothetical protein BJ912DRAFT_963354, partial [Pholiota molesta]
FCNKLPYEVLAKIFTHCLSQHPLMDVQPNTKIAPMLLTVALTTATLWSHLHCQLPIKWDYTGHPSISFANRNLWKGAMEFLRWWKKNHGAIPPFLRIRDRPKNAKPRPGSELFRGLSRYADREELPEQQFLLEYLSSAQYLDAHLLYRYLTLQAVNSRTRVMSPNLHTLVTIYSTNIQINEDDEAPSMFSRLGGIMEDHQLPFVPLQLPPTLRRLSLRSDDRGHQLGWINDRTDWYTLTHLILNVTCTLSDWSSTIRAVPRLQWGRFCIGSTDSNCTPPTHFSLPTLSTLFMTFGTSNRFVECPLGALFDNLEFPVLQELHLRNTTSAWWDSRTATNMAALLRCTPMLTKLTLAGDSIYSVTGDNSLDVLTTDVKPLSWHSPLLTHLQLHLLCPYDVDSVDILGEQFVRRIFHAWPWLDFGSPASTIRTVTIVIDRAPLSGNSERLLKASIVQNVRTNINKVAEDVTFKVRLECDPGHLPLPDETLETWAA